MSASDYANGKAPHSIFFYFEGMWLDADMYSRMKFVFKYVRDRGATISGNEGYRWLGVPADKNVRTKNKTSDGTSNQWFQKGREARGETPSAAVPGFSNHGKCKSTDTDTSDIALRDIAFALVGMRRDIRSETWHGTIFRDPIVDLSSYAFAAGPVTVLPTRPTTETDDDVLNIYRAKNDHGFIFEGWTYLQAEDGTLRALSALEFEKLAYHQSRGEAKLAIAEWDGKDIHTLATQLGLWEFVGTKLEGPRGLTGRIIGRDAPIDGSEPRDGSENRHAFS
jgi:hypothetical protein